MDRTLPCLGVLLLSLSTSALGASENKGLANQAREVLATHCYRCHGENGTVEGGLNYLLDRDRLVALKKVIPGDPDGSRLLQRAMAGEMPPSGEKKRPGKEELAILADWVKNGASELRASAKRQAISHRAVLDLIGKDLDGLAEEDRPFARYLTLTDLYNLGASEDELTTYRQALSKLINSLSWAQRIVVPTAIDPARTILRIDLRHYLWTRQAWGLLSMRYRYTVFAGSEAATRIQEVTGESNFALRGDWFATVATDPVVTAKLLDLPSTFADLQTRLRVDVDGNLCNDQAARAGFKNSSVSSTPRIIERHDSPFGAFWLTYDGANLGTLFDKQSFLASRGTISRGFDHLVLFHLPNGLQGYASFSSGGQLNQKAIPSVHDPRVPDRSIHSGLSCMSCHSGGVIFREDQVQAHFQANRGRLPATALNHVRALFVPKQTLRKAIEQDNKRYREAVVKTGCRPGTTEPAIALALRHEEEVNLKQAAIELDQTPEELTRKLEQVEQAVPSLTPLRKGGTMKRWDFIETFPRLLPHQPRNAFISHTPPLRPRPELLLPLPPPSQATEGLVELIPGLREVRIPEQLKVTAETDHLAFEFPQQPGQVIAVSPSERRLAFESRSGVVTLLDVDAGQQRALEGHRQGLVDLSFSPDGRYLATASRDRDVRVWNVAAGSLVHRLQMNRVPPVRPGTGRTDQEGWVSAVRFSPDGKVLAVLGDQVQLWDVRKGERLPTTFLKVNEPFAQLAFSPDGRLLATTGRSVRVWEVASGMQKGVFREHRTGATGIAFSADGKLLATGGSDGTTLLWDVETLEQKASLKGSREAISTLAFSQDGKLLLAGTAGLRRPGELKTWKVDERKVDTTLSIDQRHGVHALAVGAGCKLLAGPGSDRRVRVWSLNPSEKLAAPLARSRSFGGHEGPIHRLRLSGDGKVLLTCGGDRTLRVWDARTGEELHNLLGHEKVVQDAAVAADGVTAYSCSRDGTLRRWDLKKGREVSKTELDPQSMHMAFSPDGTKLAVGSIRGPIRLLDSATGKTMQELEGLDRAIQSLAFSSNGNLLAAADQGRNLRIWDLATGKGRGLSPVQGHKGMTSQLAFSPDGKILASGSADRTVCLWDVESGKEVSCVGMFPSFVHGVLFAPDGQSLYVATGSTSTRPMTKEVSLTGCAVVQVDVSGGKVKAYWTHLDGIPMQSVWSGSDLLTACGNAVQRWTPEKGKSVPRP